jgi:hypothetical protein
MVTVGRDGNGSRGSFTRKLKIQGGKVKIAFQTFFTAPGLPAFITCNRQGFVHSLCMTKHSSRATWAFHTLANALPAGILAFRYYLKDGADFVAMLAVVLLFVVAVPLTPLWSLYRGKGEWSESFRISLAIRSGWSLILSLFLAGFRTTPFHFIELNAGLISRGLVNGAVQMAGWTSIAEVHWILTAVMTLITGLTLLGVAGVLCLIVKGIRFAMRGAKGC